MTHVGYIVAGYSITFGAIAAYSAWVLARSRSLARSLPTPDGPPDAGPDASRSVGPLGPSRPRR